MSIKQDLSEYVLQTFDILGDATTSYFKRSSYIERRLSPNIRIVQSKRGNHFWALGRYRKSLQVFNTGSRYLGEWNAFDFSGDGLYRYPHGVIYHGEFNINGLYHGRGSLIYPTGQKIQGMWTNGRLENESAYTSAGTEVLEDNEKYCQGLDRRFIIEIDKDFGPAGQEYLTANQPTKELPEGCYDVRLGIYSTKTHCITSFPKSKVSIVKRAKPVSFHYDEKEEEQFNEIFDVPEDDPYVSYLGKQYDENPFTFNDSFLLEIPTAKKVEWIEKHCRKAWDEPTGYRPDLYERWIAGYKEDIYSKTFRTKKKDLEVKSVPSDSFLDITQISEKQPLVSFIQKFPTTKSVAKKVEDEIKKKLKKRQKKMKSRKPREDKPRTSKWKALIEKHFKITI
ncbi:hypothetical protein JTB14_006387 [Gonioctena quinquepunctata]|nr:hypothetical protein JTB14_006387 [Gonioctena quinquepunctata]